MPTARRIALAAGLALCVGLAAVRLFDGPHENGVLALLELVALVVCALAVVGGTLLAIGLRMADWREPESESDFEQVVQRSERLAQVGTAAEPEEGEFLELDPWSDADFEELVREALDDLPDLLQGALERNVAVVVSDGGARAGAYGLYHGDGVARDEHPDRIVVYRDTLRRDFGHDADRLRAEVTRTVRHELAHHLGADELGVRDLGL